MEKAVVLCQGTYSDKCVVGVFSTLENAQLWVRQREEMNVEHWPIFQQKYKLYVDEWKEKGHCPLHEPKPFPESYIKHFHNHSWWIASLHEYDYEWDDKLKDGRQRWLCPEKPETEHYAMLIYFGYWYVEYKVDHGIVVSTNRESEYTVEETSEII